MTVSLAATDNTCGSGVDKIYYTTNGSTPTTTSTVYTAPFAISNTATVKFFATHKAGNAEAVKSQAVQIERTAPVTAISCNGAACSTGWYRTTPVTVTLAATDTGGSGVLVTAYTTDGSDPRTSPTAKAYTAPHSTPILRCWLMASLTSQYATETGNCARVLPWKEAVLPEVMLRPPQSRVAQAPWRVPRAAPGANV